MPSEELGSAFVRIGVANAQLSSDLRQAETRFQKSAQNLGRIGARIGAAITASVAVRGIQQAVQAWDRQAQAVAKVETLIQSTQKAAGFALRDLEQEAQNLQRNTIFGDEEILNKATAQLLTFTNIAGEQFLRTQRVALDLATVLDGDLQSASIQLGKALNDPVKNLSALSRSGIQFSASQTETIKTLASSNRLAEAQNVILQELERQYGGTAEAAAKAGTGGIKQLGNALSDLQEEIGGVFGPLANQFARILQGWIQAFSKLDDGTKRWIIGVSALVGVLVPLSVALRGISLLFTPMTLKIAAIAAAIGLVVGAFFLWERHGPRISSLIASAVVKGAEVTVSALSRLVGAFAILDKLNPLFDVWGPAADELEKLSYEFRVLGQGIDATTPPARSLSADLQEIADKAKSAAAGLGLVTPDLPDIEIPDVDTAAAGLKKMREELERTKEAIDSIQGRGVILQQRSFAGDSFFEIPSDKLRTESVDAAEQSFAELRGRINDVREALQGAGLAGEEIQSIVKWMEVLGLRTEEVDGWLNRWKDTSQTIGEAMSAFGDSGESALLRIVDGLRAGEGPLQALQAGFVELAVGAVDSIRAIIRAVQQQIIAMYSAKAAARLLTGDLLGAARAMATGAALAAALGAAAGALTALGESLRSGPQNRLERLREEQRRRDAQEREQPAALLSLSAPKVRIEPLQPVSVAPPPVEVTGSLPAVVLSAPPVDILPPAAVRMPPPSITLSAPLARLTPEPPPVDLQAFNALVLDPPSVNLTGPLASLRADPPPVDLQAYPAISTAPPVVSLSGPLAPLRVTPPAVDLQAYPNLQVDPPRVQLAGPLPVEPPPVDLQRYAPVLVSPPPVNLTAPLRALTLAAPPVDLQEFSPVSADPPPVDLAGPLRSITVDAPPVAVRAFDPVSVDPPPAFLSGGLPPVTIDPPLVSLRPLAVEPPSVNLTTPLHGLTLDPPLVDLRSFSPVSADPPPVRLSGLLSPLAIDPPPVSLRALTLAPPPVRVGGSLSPVDLDPPSVNLREFSPISALPPAVDLTTPLRSLTVAPPPVDLRSFSPVAADPPPVRLTGLLSPLAVDPPPVNLRALTLAPPLVRVAGSLSPVDLDPPSVNLREFTPISALPPAVDLTTPLRSLTVDPPLVDLQTFDPISTGPPPVFLSGSLDPVTLDPPPVTVPTLVVQPPPVALSTPLAALTLAAPPVDLQAASPVRMDPPSVDVRAPLPDFLVDPPLVDLRAFAPLPVDPPPVALRSSLASILVDPPSLDLRPLPALQVDPPSVTLAGPLESMALRPPSLDLEAPNRLGVQAGDLPSFRLEPVQEGDRRQNVLVGIEMDRFVVDLDQHMKRTGFRFSSQR